MGSFRPIFDFELKRKRLPAKLKIIQLKLSLEPARLELITTNYNLFKVIFKVTFNSKVS